MPPAQTLSVDSRGETDRGPTSPPHRRAWRLAPAGPARKGRRQRKHLAWIPAAKRTAAQPHRPTDEHGGPPPPGLHAKDHAAKRKHLAWNPAAKRTAAQPHRPTGAHDGPAPEASELEGFIERHRPAGPFSFCGDGREGTGVGGGGGTNPGDAGLDLSGSWQQGHSATYNAPSRI